MKRIVFASGIIAVLALIGCLKEDKVEPCVVRTLEQDKPVITKFAADSSITTTEDPTGLFYQVIEPGTGIQPATRDTVVAKYVGRLLDGRKFDESASAKFPLSGVIEGWRIGIPKIAKGGKIKLLIPAKLAYACMYHPLQNQPLYFYVEILDVIPAK